MANEPTGVLDLETRSACSIKACGSWRYAQDPTTEVLCAAFRLPHWPQGVTGLWHPHFTHLGMRATAEWDLLEELFIWVEEGGLVESHNAAFEGAIWKYILTPRHGWPVLPLVQRRCSAAKAAAHSLPRGLDDACAALTLPLRKDAAGHKVMMKLNKPRKPRKAERASGVTGLLWHESKELFDQLFDYCKMDVLVEEALSAALPDLSPAEQELYQLDQTINERGFRLDSSAIATALRLIQRETILLNDELSTLTGGRVQRVTQRAQLQAWLETEGLYLDDTQAATVDAYLDPACREPISDKARQALTILRSLGRSSTAKYESMAHWICPNDRAHGCLVFHGASTGRWTGAGPQPQNLPKGTLKNVAMEDVWDYLLSI